MEGYLTAAALLCAAYFAWRVWSCAKRRTMLNQEISCLVYLLLWVVLQLLSLLIPAIWSKTGTIVSLGIWMVVSGVISYYLNQRYRNWLEAELEKDDGAR